MILKMVLDNGLLNTLTFYAPYSGKPQNEMVVLAGDMNGHIGSSNVGYDGTHGGFGYGDRNADGSRILEFTDGLHLVNANFMITLR